MKVLVNSNGKILKNDAGKILISNETRMFTWTATAGQNKNFQIRLDSGKTLTINWGDGSIINYIGTGTLQTVSRTYVAAGSYNVEIQGDYSFIREIDLSSRGLIGSLDKRFNLMTGLEVFRANSNSIDGVIPFVSLPSGLVTFWINSTSITGDISGWILPSGLADFRIFNTSLSGNVSSWNLPSGLVTFLIFSTSVTGDISVWILPSSLSNFQIYNTSVTGDISVWILPSGLVTFWIFNTSLSGNVSSWILPSGLVTFWINSASITGDISSWILPSGLTTFFIFNASVSGDISGWVLPSSLSSFRISDTSVSGDISTWILPSSLVSFLIFSTSVIGAKQLVNYIFLNRTSYNNSANKVFNISNIGESFGFTVNQGDTGTYGGNFSDLTEAQITDLYEGEDFDGLGTNTPWDLGDQAFALVNMKVSNASSTPRYRWTITV